MGIPLGEQDVQEIEIRLQRKISATPLSSIPSSSSSSAAEADLAREGASGRHPQQQQQQQQQQLVTLGDFCSLLGIDVAVGSRLVS